MTDEEALAREPLFRSTWTAVAIPLILLAAYLWQIKAGANEVELTLGLSAERLAEGHFETLITHLFVHGSWLHLGMNCAAALIFGTAVARYLGPGLWGAVVFFSFFLVCGVLAGLGYVLAHPLGMDVAVGASGAISGLWGAATRLLIGRGRLAPVFDRLVLTQSAVILAVNVVMGLAGTLQSMNIAWEAHVAGFIAGLLLIGPAGRLIRRA